jgi:hypothetical protein
MRAPPKEGKAPHPTIVLNHTQASESYPVRSNPENVLVVSVSLMEFSEEARMQASMVQTLMNLARATNATSLVHMSFDISGRAGSDRAKKELNKLVAPYW